MVFASSANNPEELVERLADQQIETLELMGMSLNNYLKERFGECVQHYEKMRARYNTTWEFRPAAKLSVFDVLHRVPVRSSVSLLDYVVVQIDPKPNQKIGIIEAQRGLDTLRDKRLITIASWVLGEGMRQVEEAYSR